MRNYLAYIFIIIISSSTISQEKKYTSYVDVNYFKGEIGIQNQDILPLRIGRPEGVIVSWNRKTFGYETWEQDYGYPDYGVSLSFQDLKNPILGNNIAIYGHYNFYFLKRKLLFRVGQGLAYASNPFDRVDNPRNIAFGSDILSSTYVLLNYKKERIFDKFGFQAGFALIHYSNASFRAPNTSVNTITLNAGLTYNFEDKEPDYIKDDSVKEKFSEPLKFNFAFRSGINESDVIGTGQFPFYILSAYIDKRLNRKSAIHVGVEGIFSKFLERFIEFQSIAFPEENVDPNTDYRRVGVFVGHELFINKLSVISQIGYYAYWPFEFETRVYLRAGLKRYFWDKWFAAVTLRAHGANAEAVEFGVGVRL